MIEKSFRLTFFLKARKNAPENLRHIFLRITINGESREISVKLDWPSDRWNAKSGMAVGNKEDALQLNNYLESIKIKVFHARIRMMEKSKDVSVDSLKICSWALILKTNISSKFSGGTMKK